MGQPHQPALGYSPQPVHVDQGCRQPTTDADLSGARLGKLPWPDRAGVPAAALRLRAALAAAVAPAVSAEPRPRPAALRAAGVPRLRHPGYVGRAIMGAPVV